MTPKCADRLHLHTLQYQHWVFDQDGIALASSTTVRNLVAIGDHLCLLIHM